MVINASHYAGFTVAPRISTHIVPFIADIQVILGPQKSFGDISQASFCLDVHTALGPVAFLDTLPGSRAWLPTPPKSMNLPPSFPNSPGEILLHVSSRFFTSVNLNSFLLLSRNYPSSFKSLGFWKTKFRNILRLFLFLFLLHSLPGAVNTNFQIPAFWRGQATGKNTRRDNKKHRLIFLNITFLQK